jgi:RimJ/RimL family protein N-acetyltransferase
VTKGTLLEPEGNSNLRLRAAEIEDSDKILEWRNDPWIVSLSSSQRKVDAEEHKRWFQNALNDPAHSINLIMVDEAEIGLLRLHRVDADEASISIYLRREFCGQGYGPRAIGLACEKAWTLWPISRISAITRKTNTASERSFKKNGFMVVTGTDSTATDLLQLCKYR